MTTQRALPWTTAHVGLGSNLGRRQQTLRQAVERLGDGQRTRVLRLSSLYETAPQGPVQQQPSFLNAVVELETCLSPPELLRRCLQVEQELGRVRAVPKGPRNIDIDLLLMGEAVLSLPELVLPHAELIHRAFALVPLLELRPMALDPRDSSLLCHHAAALVSAQPILRLGALAGQEREPALARPERDPAPAPAGSAAACPRKDVAA